MADEPTTCPVHGVPLERKRMRVVYGLPVHQTGYEEALETRFPFGEPPMGGCCVPPVPESAVVAMCPRCVEERRAWQDARRARRPGAPPSTP